MIVDTNFSVLNNNDTKGFWAGMLDAERRRKSTAPTSSTFTAAEINSLKESDSLHMDGCEKFVANLVGSEGRATIVVDRKNRYFHALGMNGILDLSDTSENSQFSKFPVDIQEGMKRLFPHPTVTIPSIDERYTKAQQDIKHTSNHHGRYYKKYLEKLENFQTNEKCDVTKKLHVILLELLLYDGYIFDDKESKLLSEGNYVVKIWGPLLEVLCRNLETRLAEMVPIRSP
ncbi:hypothetical protein INT47_002398, partial [Mucor saturninus]